MSSHLRVLSFTFILVPTFPTGYENSTKSRNPASPCDIHVYVYNMHDDVFIFFYFKVVEEEEAAMAAEAAYAPSYH